MSLHSRPQFTNCKNCFCQIDQRVLEYSIERYNFALCVPCQCALKTKIKDSSKETINLYFSLRKRNIEAVLEKFGDYKTIDIAVVDAKVNIEVDGRHYSSGTEQAFPDLKQTYYPFKKGFLTLRIPNALVRNNLDETADYIKVFLATNKQKNARQ